MCGIYPCHFYVDPFNFADKSCQRQGSEVEARDQDGYQRYFICETESEESDTGTGHKM